MANKNAGILAKGRAKFERMVESQFADICERFAIEALWGAVSAWDADKNAKDLTGNMRTSFAAGVYKDGSLKNIYNVFDIDKGIEKPTHGMTYVGDSGFRVYGKNFYIGSEKDPFVRDYSQKRHPGVHFQSTNVGEFAYNETTEALRSYRPKSKGWTVIVASVTPYGQYIHDARNLDILDSQAVGGGVARNLMVALATVKDIDFYAKETKR